MKTFIFERSSEEGFFIVSTLPDSDQTEFVLKSDAENRIKELGDQLLFLVNNDSINDSSIEKEILIMLARSPANPA